MRGIALTVVWSLAMGVGAASATATAKPDDAGATWTYLQAEYSFTRTVYAELSRSGEAVTGIVGRVERECPRVLAGAPEGRDLDGLRQEAGVTVLYTALTPDIRPALDVARAVGRLRWTDRRLTRMVRLEAANNRGSADLLLTLPNLCADARAWVSSGYRKLSAGTVRFNKATEALSTGPVVEPLPLLVRYEGPRARLLAHRIQRLRAAFPPRFPAERWVTLGETAIGAVPPSQPVRVRQTKPGT
jgi:hypothetical protein